MNDYSAALLIVFYFLVFSGMRAGKQSFMISLLWPAMFGLLLAVELRQYDKEASANQE